MHIRISFFVFRISIDCSSLWHELLQKKKTTFIFVENISPLGLENPIKITVQRLAFLLNEI